MKDEQREWKLGVTAYKKKTRAAQSGGKGRMEGRKHRRNRGSEQGQMET